MKRTIVPVTEYYSTERWTEPITLQALQTEAVSMGAKYLFAHADDGVIWGRVEEHQIIIPATEGESLVESLNETTLQQLWLFGVSGEAYFWRNAEGWQVRRVRSNHQTHEGKPLTQAIDEKYLLYGTHSAAFAEGFTLVQDGEQGLRYAFPQHIEFDTKDDGLRLWLRVRQYVSTNDDGFSQIFFSRLVSLEVAPNDEQ